MSTIDTHGDQGTPQAISPENENLPVGKIAAVAIVSCTCFALAVLWAVGILHGVVEETQQQTGVVHKAEAIGRPEIGMVDQQLYQVEHRANELTQAKLGKLEQYGWVSRKDQLIHIPITEAMKAVIAGKRAPVGMEQPAAPEPQAVQPGQGQGPTPAGGTQNPAPAGQGGTGAPHTNPR